MGERILSTRRVKPDRGEVIRVSTPVHRALDNQRLNNRKISWDVFFRRFLGMPDRKGRPATPLIEGYLEVTTGKFFLATSKSKAALEKAEQDAYEVAIKAAGKKRVNPPIRMREHV